jgi:hypothetical protein
MDALYSVTEEVYLFSSVARRKVRANNNINVLNILSGIHFVSY